MRLSLGCPHTPSQSQKAKIMVKILDEYRSVKDLPPPAPSKPVSSAAPVPAEKKESVETEVTSAHPFPAAPGVALTADTAVTPAQPSESTVERLLKEQQEATAKKMRGRTDMILYAPSVNDSAQKVPPSLDLAHFISPYGLGWVCRTVCSARFRVEGIDSDQCSVSGNQTRVASSVEAHAVPSLCSFQ